MDIKQDILTRVGIIYILIFVFGLSVVGKIVHIQYFDEDIAARAAKAEVKTNIIKPKRGDIYSRDGRVLACSVPEYVVYFDYRIPAFDKSDTLFRNNVDKLAEGLAKLFASEGKSKQEYLKELHNTAKKDSYLRLHKKPIDFNTLQEIKKLPILEKGPYKGGLLIDTYNSRVYPFGDIAKRTIGLLPKKGYHGKTGLELYYDSYLYGIEGEQTYNNDPANNGDNNGTIDGYDLITTIDTEIQSIANEELERSLKEHKGAWGCAIVMEVKTGEILAISNLKANKIHGDTVFYEAYNYAVDKRCEPGSTIKLPSLMIALEDGLVKLTDTVDTKNGIVKFYPNQSIVDWNHYTQGGFGRLSVKDVFANSSNVGVTKIIYDNYDQPNKEWDYISRLRSMGLNRISEVDMSKEPAPLIKDPSMTKSTDDYKWYASDLVQMAYGYSIELTPLQMLMMVRK